MATVAVGGRFFLKCSLGGRTRRAGGRIAADLAQANVASELNTANCFGSGEPISPDFSGTLTHPSGATGTFTFGPVQHGRTRVPQNCVNQDSLGNVGDDYSCFTLRQR